MFIRKALLRYKVYYKYICQARQYQPDEGMQDVGQHACSSSPGLLYSVALLQVASFPGRPR